MAVRQDASTGALEQIHVEGATETKTAPQMHVKIYSPFKTYIDEQAVSVSAENATGPFDILPHHHNFITLLQNCELAVNTAARGMVKIRISGGLMHVKADEVTVFLDV